MGYLHSKETKKDLKNKDNPRVTRLIDDKEEVVIKTPIDKLENDIVSPKFAYKIIKDELLDEGNARLNLATFCQTSMEKEAVQLISETLEKNAFDKSEYPKSTEIENRCVAIIADLWGCSGNQSSEFIGTSTVGSSEACMLGGMVLKFKWQEEIAKLIKAKKLKDDPKRKPNIVISSAYQVCWEKFCVYWEVEMRTIPIDEKHLAMDGTHLLDYVDENTIGIIGILGLTYTGMYDNIEQIDQVIESYNQKYNGLRPPVKIHVDAASGGFFAPFVTPEIKWDFRLKNVVSISASGHKYGLVFPGIGWVVWKDKDFVPKKLIFEVSYLGGKLSTMAINCSRSASFILAQYYQFLRLGKKGYTAVQKATRDVALYISNELVATGLFEIINNGAILPIVCWKIKDQKKLNWTLYDLSDVLLSYGWQVPSYPLAANLENVDIQRIVVKQDLSMDLAIQLVKDFKESIAKLNQIYKNSFSESYNSKK